VTRDNNIKLTDDEMAELRSATQDMFGTEEVPWGVTIKQLVNHWRDTDSDQ